MDIRPTNVDHLCASIEQEQIEREGIRIECRWGYLDHSVNMMLGVLRVGELVDETFV